MCRLASALLIAVLLSIASPLWNQGNSVAHAACTPVTNNLVVRTDTTFCAGSYGFTDREANGVIVVGADGITIDGAGLILNGRGNTGYGIYLNGHRDVVIRNFSITRFFHGIRIENASGVRVENAKVWNNGGVAERFYDILRPMASSYGGGILVSATTNSTFTAITGVQDQANPEVSGNQNVGIDMYQSSGNTIAGSDWSNNYGWGIRLYASDGNTISGNKADHVHGCRGVNCSSRDTAGILLTQGSDDNVISDNSIVNGGDGFFIGNQNATPSNNNQVLRNDATGAIHNAFEATFSTGNVFEGNIASDSAYGFWLGYSYASEVRANEILRNAYDGINWEHGHDGVISGNHIARNGFSGVALMIRSATGPPSYGHSVTENTILANGQNGIYVAGTTGSAIGASAGGNTFGGNNVNISVVAGSAENVATQNNIVCTYRDASGEKTCQFNAYTDTDAGKHLNAEKNWWGTADRAAIAASVYDGADVPGRGIIDYDPWLTSPSKSAP